jgi:hypothetical protein
VALLDFPISRPRFQLRFGFGFREPPRDGLWHRYMPLLSVRLIDGTTGYSALGDIFCRFRGGRWEYRQEARDWIDDQL